MQPTSVQRFTPTPAYKRRRFEREVERRVHASSVRPQPVTAEDLDLGGDGTYSRGEQAKDWSAA